jgi:hypothetical protein
VAANLPTWTRAEIEEHIMQALAFGTWSSRRAYELAHQYSIHPGSVWRIRSRALQRMASLSPDDIEGERCATLMRLDDIVTAAINDSKPSAAVSALRLKMDLLGLRGGPENKEDGGRSTGRTVDDLLRTIEEAGRLQDRLGAEVVQEDEEE